MPFLFRLRWCDDYQHVVHSIMLLRRETTYFALASAASSLSFPMEPYSAPVFVYTVATVWLTSQNRSLEEFADRSVLTACFQHLQTDVLAPWPEERFSYKGKTDLRGIYCSR